MSSRARDVFVWAMLAAAIGILVWAGVTRQLMAAAGFVGLLGAAGAFLSRGYAKRRVWEWWFFVAVLSCVILMLWLERGSKKPLDWAILVLYTLGLIALILDRPSTWNAQNSDYRQSTID